MIPIPLIVSIVSFVVVCFIYLQVRKNRICVPEVSKRIYKAASTDAIQDLFESLESNDLKQALLLQIAENGLTNIEYDFLMNVSDRFMKEKYPHREKAEEQYE